MKGLTHIFPLVLSILLVCTSTQASADNNVADDKGIQIYVPESTQNGSFVIRVGHQKNTGDSTQIQLWRSYNGGQWELISAHHRFNAISQMVYKPGTYGYQARIISTNNDEQELQQVSDTSYIDVNLRYRTNRIASIPR